MIQPSLFPLDAAPVKVRQHGLRAAHAFPLVSLGKNADGGMACFRVPAKHAWKFPSLELRGGHVWPALILDLDQFSGYEGFCHLLWEHPGLLPWPNWTVERVSNGHFHGVWTFATPVHRGPKARPKPLYALARVSEYFTQVAKADPGYNGVLTHNPMKRAHQPGTVESHWGVTKPYPLKQLLAYVPKHWRMPSLPASDIGRHERLYRGGMKWAGSEANLGRPVLPYLLDRNQKDLTPPKHEREVAYLARSIERYRERWIAEGRFYTAQQRFEWGRQRGLKSGEARRAKVQERDETIVDLSAQGWSQRAIAKEFGLSQRAINHILRRGDT